jgi:hypothetical protein
MATFAGWECVDPASFARACAAQNPPIDTSRWHGKAGSFTVPLGRGPGRGWVLLTGAALAAIDPTADHPLVFVGSDPAHVRTFPRITLLRAECCAPGSAADPAAVYACELADRRHLLAMIPAPNRAYNLRKPDGSDDYLPASINGLAPWSWQDVVDDLVAALGLTDIFLLPFEPDGVPESLAYYAPGSAWDALCDVLARLECAAEYDPETDTFAVVRLGAADATFAAADAALARARLWDGYGAEAVRAWRPETVRTVFRRVPPPTDGASPYYVVDTALGAAAGVEPGTAVQVEDDLIARVPPGSPGGLPANLADLTARAAERASDWLRRRAGFDAPLLRSYADYQPAGALLGSRVHAVVFDDRGGPFATTIYSAPTAPWKPAETMPPALTAPLWAPGPRPTSGTSGPSASGPDDNGFPGRRFPGDFRDPVAVRDVQCVEGVLYRTTGRQQVVQDDDGRARLDWYDLRASVIGCCLRVRVGQRPGVGGGRRLLPGRARRHGGRRTHRPVRGRMRRLGPQRHGHLRRRDRGWVGTATGGSVSAVVVLSCDGVGTWHLYALVTLADGTQVVAEGHLDTEGETLVGTPELSDGTGCTDAALSAVIGHPCVTAPGCDCPDYPDGRRRRAVHVHPAGGTGDFAGANGDWTLVQVNGNTRRSRASGPARSGRGRRGYWPIPTPGFRRSSCPTAAPTSGTATGTGRAPAPPRRDGAGGLDRGRGRAPRAGGELSPPATAGPAGR